MSAQTSGTKKATNSAITAGPTLAYRTISNYLEMLPKNTDIPEMPPLETFRSDGALLSYLSSLFQTLVEAMAKTKVQSTSLSNTLAETKRSVLARQADRKKELLSVETQIQGLTTSLSEAPQAAIQEIDQTKRDELLLKRRKWLEKEEKVRQWLEELEKEEGEVLVYSPHSSTQFENKDKTIEEIKQLENTAEALRSYRENLEIKVREIDEYETLAYSKKAGLKSQKGTLANQAKALCQANQKKSDKYWELFANQQAIDEEHKQIDAEMQRLREENSKLQADTSQLELLSRGLDEQEQINILLEQRLSALRTKLNQQQPVNIRTSHMNESISRSHYSSSPQPPLHPSVKTTNSLNKNKAMIRELEIKAQQMQALAEREEQHRLKRAPLPLKTLD